MSKPLVGAAADRVDASEQHERRNRVAVRSKNLVVEVGKRHDERRFIATHERRDRLDVGRVTHRRDQLPMIGGVQRRRELAQVCGNGRGTGTSKRRDDVDALTGACEEHNRHAPSA